MADWDITWKPDIAYAYEAIQKTNITTVETGPEQRRQKWSREKFVFYLTFSAKPTATVDAIREFFLAREGALGAFNFPNYDQFLEGTRLALVDGGGGSDTLTDSSSGLVTKGWTTDSGVAIEGSGASNDGYFMTISGVAAGTLTLPTGQWTAGESSNSSLRAYKAFSVRFGDVIGLQNVTPDLDGITTIQLIEDI